MAKKPTITTISSGYTSTTTLNANFEALKEAFDNTLSRDGSTPNSMNADLDMNSNDILNASRILVGGQDYLALSLSYKDAALAAQLGAELAETNAQTSETNAATSATSASSSAAAAAASVASIGTSVADAAASAASAATSETNAANSAASASTSSTSASTSASSAATSASQASSSATSAASSASTASTSATAAQAAQTGAEAAYDSFDDRYLGAKASAPTTDNDGDPLLTGALYYNTTASQLYIWNGSLWDDAAFSASGSVTSFNTRTGAITLNSTDVSNASGLLTTNNLSDLTNAATARTNLGLGTAATTASTDYATAAQGALADSALQSSDIGVSVQGYSAVLAGTTASYTTAEETKLAGIEPLADVTDTANVTAAGALMDSEVTNLAAVKAFDPNDYVGQTTTTGSAELPVGTTAQRDGTPAAGYIRFNSTDSTFEGYDGTAWGAIGGAGGGLFKGENGEVGSSAGDIFRVNEQTLNTSVTIDADENASATGPLAIASGVTLTVTSGGNLSIV